MVESWTYDMEVEQHASSVSSEIGFQGVGAVNRPDKLSYGRIVKRAQRNGFLDVGRCSKARKLNNNVKNLGSNTNPKSTPSKTWDGDERNEIKDRKCLNNEEKDIVTSDGKGLPSVDKVGNSLKNAIDIRRFGALTSQNIKDDNSGANINSKNKQENDVFCLDTRNDGSNHKIDRTQLNGRCPVLSRKQKSQISLNGHYGSGIHVKKSGKVVEKFDSKVFEEDSTDSLGETDDCRMEQTLERYRNLIFEVRHASCGAFSEQESIRNDSKASVSVNGGTDLSYSSKNGFLGNKCMHLGTESHDQDFKRVRLKNSSATSDKNTSKLNSSQPMRSEYISKNCHSNVDLDVKECNINGFHVSDSDVAGTLDNGVFKAVDKSNDNTYHTKQKSRHYNTTTKLIENNIVKDGTNKINIHIGEETTFCKIEDEIGSSSVDSPTIASQETFQSVRVNSRECKRANGQSSKSSESSSMVCNWVNCDAKLNDAMELKTHVKEVHVKTMAASDLFFCFWKGCKVYNKPSSSYNWLVKHVNTHVGIRPFQCVIEPCSLSFASHGALIRHVQSHFNERSKYYKKPKNPAKEAVPSPGRTEDTLSGSESTSSKESKKRQAKIFMRRTKHFNSNLVNDDLDRDSMVYIKKKLFHLENTCESSLRINGLRSIIQPLGRRTLEDDRSEFLTTFSSNERQHKWYNENEVLYGGLCQLPITQLPSEQQDKLYVEVFGAPKQRRGRKYNKKVFA